MPSCHAPDEDLNAEVDRRLDRGLHQEPHRPAPPRSAPVAERIVVGRAPRLVTLTINLDELPAAISQSIVTTLRPHRAVLARCDIDNLLEERLGNTALQLIVAELGRNVAQTVLACGVGVDR